MNILDLTNKSWEVFSQYVNVINEYLLFFTNSKKFKKGERDSIYLLKTGFTTLTYVFKTIMTETLNMSKAVENTKHSIIYYTNFIEQNEENLMDDLNVSSNNASIFVYKKTINDIIPNIQTITNELNQVINNIDYLMNIYKSSFEQLINEDISDISDISDKLMNMAIEICNTNNENENEFNNKLLNIILFMNHLPEEKKNKYDYLYFYIKKYKHHKLSLIDLLLKKSDITYNDKLMNYTIQKYIKWIMT